VEAVLLGASVNVELLTSQNAQVLQRAKAKIFTELAAENALDNTQSNLYRLKTPKSSTNKSTQKFLRN
jgi:hypothetical protein